MDPLDIFVRFVWYFTIFAVLGYIAEALNSLLHGGKLSNRGFLFGPYLPIYGFGAVAMVIIWQFMPHDNVLLTFFVAMSIGVILEYVTSYVLEKIFHLRWWDYSKSDKLNLNGRICLRNSIVFGLGGCLFCFLMLPAADNFIDIIPKVLQDVIAAIMIIIYALDVVVSSYANMQVKNMEDFSKVVGDQTKEIKKNAKKVIKELFATPERIAKRIEKARRRAERKAKRRARRNAKKRT
ncbi:putative ABC transporter permease [Candidatus Saccharibacteria bacterium]|nr:putative ABC transporter permease [Candidatus Saccharibacteria bacterium]